jgi:hypothetical protein
MQLPPVPVLLHHILFRQKLPKILPYNASVQRKCFGCRNIFLPLLRFNEAGDMLALENQIGTRHL